MVQDVLVVAVSQLQNRKCDEIKIDFMLTILVNNKEARMFKEYKHASASK